MLPRSPLPTFSEQRRRSASRRQRGITLPEMAVIVVVVGLLAGIMLPGYLQSVHRAKRSEAFFALRAIHDAQSFYFAKQNAYTDDFGELAFDLDGGELRPDGAYQGSFYTYTLGTWSLGGQPAGNYRATATGNIDPSDDILDIVIIENALTVKDN